EPQVAVLDARVVAVAVQDELDDQRRDHGVEVSAAGAVHHVAVGGEDAHQRVAGDAHRAAAGPDEHLHALIQDVIGPLEADLVLPGGQHPAGGGPVGDRGELEPGQLLFQRRDHRAAPFWSWSWACSRPKPCRSIRYRMPGGITTVVSGASTMAGP